MGARVAAAEAVPQMDHKTICSGFQPPPPMSIRAYFDDVTSRKIKNIGNLSIWELDEVLATIKARPTLQEQAALLSELEDRFVAYAGPFGWLTPSEPESEDRRVNRVTKFIVTDMLGLKNESVSEKVFGEFTKQVKEVVKEGLNSKGRNSFKVLEILWALCQAKTGDDVVAALAKIPFGLMQTWLAVPQNRAWLARAALRAGGVSPVIRNRLLKLMAARLAWVEVSLSRLARWIPLYTALDIFFTSEQIATDATERRLTFMMLYARLFSERSGQFGRLVRSCTDSEWQFAVPPPALLSRAILRMP
jgi:hypothetical protein